MAHDSICNRVKHRMGLINHQQDETRAKKDKEKQRDLAVILANRNDHETRHQHLKAKNIVKPIIFKLLR